MEANKGSASQFWELNVEREPPLYFSKLFLTWTDTGLHYFFWHVLCMMCNVRQPHKRKQTVLFVAWSSFWGKSNSQCIIQGRAASALAFKQACHISSLFSVRCKTPKYRCAAVAQFAVLRPALCGLIPHFCSTLSKPYFLFACHAVFSSRVSSLFYSYTIST